eukprot:gnl/MRDRNA2_/MRDRNA2_266743_c0_seq1.p1 gnl/MRDRNA2_/MRDRNA2_266743_c0~~gnl/MRDRNA2_/MRDRNA2_266743_c0_seq1.p1  ORF type:complete len:200 (+),score=25.87 gnl/MRDRNA2_/MRDRNA2_266743_c0_seq1:38-601(+)
MYAPWAQTGYDLVTSAGGDAGCGVSTLLFAQYAQMHTSVFTYAFSAVSTSPELYSFGSMHLLELMFLLNDTFIFDNHKMDSTELALVETMLEAWSSFAKYGIPEVSGLTGSQIWVLFNATGFSSIHGPVQGQAVPIGHSHWNVIALPGVVSVRDFRQQQFTFFCNWHGDMVPALLSVAETSYPIIYG